jgi:CDP-diacylglycerol--glycerol-3-phosphate 3-phosphatidyltransferase
VSAGTPISPAMRQRLKGLAVPIAMALGRLGLTPNALTIIGFIGTCVAALAAASQAWVLAGALVIVFGIFDLFDGALARTTGRVTKFGAFLDSTLDRTGENLVLGGIAFACASLGFDEGVALAILALAIGSMVTYTRARAEGIGVHGEVGVAPRPERLVLIAIGLIAAGWDGDLGPASGPIPPGMACAGACIEAGGVGLLAALGLLTLLSAITVIQRIVHVYRQTEGDSSS